MQAVYTRNYPLYALPYYKVLHLANTVSTIYSLPFIPAKTLMQQYSTKSPMPIIMENEKGRIWVDKYYIAIQMTDGIVRYVYLTRHHIQEEYQSYLFARRTRRNRVYLPDTIKKEFQSATSKMNRKNKNYYVFEKWILKETK